MMIKSKKGFSLIELLIVIAIIGILAALAVPKYKEYTLRGKFIDVINSVNPLKATLAACYSMNSTYQNCSGIDTSTPANNVQIAFKPRVDSIEVSAKREVVTITANASTAAFGFADGKSTNFTYVLQGSAASDGSQSWLIHSSSTCIGSNSGNAAKISLCQIAN